MAGLFEDAQWRPELDAILDAVKQAGFVCERIAGDSATSTVTKTDDSPVTLADYASQHIIVNAIQQAYPNDAIVAEEDLTLLDAEQQARLASYIVLGAGLPLHRKPAADAHRFWTIDPIDGTRGYIRNGQYAVCVALIEDRQVVLALLNCPRLANSFGGVGTMFLAMKGHGCYEVCPAGGQTKLLGTQDKWPTPEGAIMAESYESRHSDHGFSHRFAARLKLDPQPVRMDSQCKYGLVARGDAHIYLRCPKKDYCERIWDHAPGQLIVEEAAGRVTDFNGDPLLFAPSAGLQAVGGIVATRLAGCAHELVLKALQEY